MAGRSPYSNGQAAVPGANGGICGLQKIYEKIWARGERRACGNGGSVVKLTSSTSR